MIAYNDMVPYQIPGSDTTAHLVSIQIHHPDDPVGQAFLQFLRQYNKK